jgi:hypothetical protein
MSILDIVHKARTLESRIARALGNAAGRAVGTSAAEPLEIVHAIVDAVERQIQPGGRGARLFPFNHVAVTVLAPSRDARARFEAVVSGTPVLRDRLIDRLRSGGCDVNDLRVDIAYAGRAARNWERPQFHVVFDSVAPVVLPPPPDATPPVPVEVTVLRGAADRRTYVLAALRIDFGRGTEVRDGRNRLLRTNQVAFIEGTSGENQTVSRRHAHIVCDPSSGDHRLHDDGSEHGTGIVRGGRTIPVPPGSRGVRVRSGDEVVLGEARVRIRIEDATPSAPRTRPRSAATR